MSDERVCPRCGSPDHTVPVWKSPRAFQEGEAPKYIGCTACNEMEEMDE